MYMPKIRNYNLADWFQERIEIQLDELSKEVKDDEELYIEVILNDERCIYPEYFGYHNPNMLVIAGEDVNGKNVTLLVDQSNIQILITKLKKNEMKKKLSIGFQTRESVD